MLPEPVAAVKALLFKNHLIPIDKTPIASSGWSFLFLPHA